MIKINKKIFSIITAVVLILPLSILDADDQLFGGSKEKDSGSSNQAAKQMVQEESPIMEIPKISPPVNRNKIESVIPVKRLPDGWVFRDELLAPWSTSLPAVLTIVPDTTVEVVYTDESRTTKDGIVLPIKRATVEFNYVTRLTIERITLGFVNIDYVYSTTNNSDSHYILAVSYTHLTLPTKA